MAEDIRPVGEVTHYFSRIGVAVIYLYEDLSIGDWIHIYGPRTNFVQQIESMQLDHQPIDRAGSESEIAVLVLEKVRKGDEVYPYEAENYS